MADLIYIRNQLSGDLPIYIGNKIIEAHFALPLGEQRLLYAYISKLSEEHIEFPELELSVKEFAEMLEVDLNYKVVRNQCKKLLERVVEIETDEEWIGFQWFSVCRYRHKEGRLRLKIHDELKPYLLRLKKEFTRLITRQVMQFRSVYSVRIYMLCKQYQAIGKRLVDVEELKKKLGIESGEYTLYSNFKNRVLKQAQKEINELSDIRIEFEEIKKARKVNEILFWIDKNTVKEIQENGVQEMFLKDTAELAGTLHKEILKRWKIDMQDVLMKYAKKELYIELLCEILRGAYDNTVIKAPRAYFEATLRKMEEAEKKRY